MEPSDVAPAIEEVERRTRHDGLHAAGFVSYEAAPAFDPALMVRGLEGFPLLCFGLFPPPEIVNPSELQRQGKRPALRWKRSQSAADYKKSVRTIRELIADGHTYQVNQTYKLTAPFAGEAWPLFMALIGDQPPPYAAFLETDRYAVCSASPELFFRLDGDLLLSRPMKGTATRGMTWADDRRQARWLRDSEKNRAENAMIVDMVRNDIGRVACAGTVRVVHPFRIEKYPTLWQMTSTVTGLTGEGLPAIFRALFPAASITGAPKCSTMGIITRLETSPRRLYTGAIGFIAPDRIAQFNVAIRTVVVDKAASLAEYGVGGGIVWDSEEDEEWQETLTKSRVLKAGRRPFRLLETLRWSPEEGYFLLPFHVRRLRHSADYFDFHYREGEIRKALERRARGFVGRSRRVRLLLSRSGRIAVQDGPLPSPPRPGKGFRVALSPFPVDASDVSLYHKTTDRRIYRKALAACPGYDDVLLWNRRGELTESTIGNIVAERDGELITPPVRCGLLAGTYRAWLLERKAVKERVVRVDDLDRLDRIHLVNALRGEWEVTMDGGRKRGDGN
jgi:para-aminobenzoate synthetase/4-amino-4-deoxychorismate lyase